MDNSNNLPQNGVLGNDNGYIGPQPAVGVQMGGASAQIDGYAGMSGQVAGYTAAPGQMNGYVAMQPSLNNQMNGAPGQANGYTGVPAGQLVNGGQSVQDQQKILEELRARKKGESLTGMIILFVVGLLAVIFLGLFVWMFIMWNEAKTNVDGQVQQKVDLAVKNNTEKMNQEFREKEKMPYRRFSGPIDYGELSFEYPKTWSMYIMKDAKTGGDYEAVFNPVSISLIGGDTNIQALRLNIMNTTFENVAKRYDGQVKSGKFKLSVMSVGGNNANVYVGTTEKGKSVRIVIFPIRDKTVYIMTDADKLYGNDFNNILKSITYNK